LANNGANINANVGINVSEGGLAKVIADLDAKIEGTLSKIAKLGDVAQGTAGKMTQKAKQDLGDIDINVKQLQRAVQQLQTLTNAGQRGTKNNIANLTGGLDDAKIARSVRAVNEFKRSLDESITTSDKLKARINAIDTETANLARTGQNQSAARLRQQEQLNTTLKEYEGLNSKLNNTTAKVGFLSPDSQRKMEAMVLEGQKLRQVFNDLAGDGRRTNFNFLTEAMKTLTLEMDKQIAALQTQERLEVKMANATRDRARELLAVSTNQRQTNIERGSASAMGKLTNNQQGLGYALGDTGLETRLTRASAGFAEAKRRLEAAMSTTSGATDKEIAKLVTQMEFFDRKIIETIALQGRRAADASAFNKQEAAAIEQTIAKYDRLAQVEKRIRFKEVSDGIRDSEKALKDFDKQLAGLDANGKISPLKKAFQGLLGDGGLGLIARVGIYATVSTAIYNVIGALKDGAKFAIEFEDKLATLQAISGATNTQLAGLSATILDTGKNSRYAVVDLAEAATQLAQAGFSVADTQVALRAVSDFAAASGTSIKESSDLITSALGAFQMQASEASRVTDIFTAALNRSKLTSQQIAQAIQYVGTTAYEQNISLEQLVATVGSVAAAGVRAGSTLGTGFRQLLVDLANPTEKLKTELSKLGLSVGDVDVKSRGLTAVLNTLKDSGFGAAQAYQGLEVRAAAFFLAAKNNLDVSQQLQLAESERGVAMIAAERAMDSLSAQTQRFYNILGKIASDAAPLEFLKSLTRAAADLAEEYSATSEEFKKLKEADLSGANGLFAQIQAQTEAWYKQANEVQNVETALYKLITTGSIYGETADRMKVENEKLATASANSADELNNQSTKVGEVANEFQKLITQGGSLRNDSVETAIVTNSLTSRFEGLTSMLGNTANGYDNLVIAMKRYQAQQLVTLSNKAAVDADQKGRQFTGLSNQLNSQVDQIRYSKEYSRLAPDSRERLEGLFRGAAAGQAGAVQGIFEFAGRLKALNPSLGQFAESIRRTAPVFSDRNATRVQGRASQRLAADATIQADPRFRQQQDRLANINGRLGAALTTATEQTAAQRAATMAPIVRDIDASIAHIDTLINQNKGKEAVLRNLNNQRQEFVAARTQATGTAKATAKETKAAEREAAKAERERKKQERAAASAARQFNSNELSASQAGLRAADKTLAAFLNGQGQNFNIKNMDELFEQGDDALSEWIDARKAVLSDAIKKAGLTQSQIKELTEAANDEIAAKQQATVQRQVEIIDKAVNSFVERSGRRIEASYNIATAELDNQVARQSGLTTGLSNPLLGIVPKSTQVVQQRQADLAQYNADLQKIGKYDSRIGSFTGGENESRIKEYNLVIEKITEQIDEMQKLKDESDKIAASSEKGSEAYRKAMIDSAGYSEAVTRLGDTFTTVNNKALELTKANDNLRAQYEAFELKPKTFGEGLQNSIQGFRIENNIGSSLQDRLIGNIDGALDTAHQSFQEFFSGVVTGTKSVGAAFGDMAKAVISAIVSMAAKAVATQIFGLLLSFIPGMAGGGSNPGGIGSNSLANNPFNIRVWNGGPIPGPDGSYVPERRIGGGAITGGLPTRDSTLVHAAKGEFMLRNSSVKSIGHELLNDMNNRGATALNKLRGSNIVMPQSRLDSNVYVVLPEERPQLGENDILAIVSRDMLRGGATKQLVKQISSGG